MTSPRRAVCLVAMLATGPIAAQPTAYVTDQAYCSDNPVLGPSGRGLAFVYITHRANGVHRSEIAKGMEYAAL
jgi:hypothetical protein